MENTSAILESPNDPVLQEDLDLLVQEGLVPFELLKGKTVFVTGATGLLGSQVVRTLACANRRLGMDIQILAFVRSLEKAEKVYQKLLERGDIQVVTGDVTKQI